MGRLKEKSGSLESDQIWKKQRDGMGARRSGGNSEEILTAAHTALIARGNKSEVTLQVPSISRLFYMGNFALMGEPSMEQS